MISVRMGPPHPRPPGPGATVVPTTDASPPVGADAGGQHSQTFVWDGSRLLPGDTGDGLLIADSWLVDEGTTRGFAEHCARFTEACHGECGLPRNNVMAFLAAVRARLPTAGRWFPRVEYGPGDAPLRLRVRPAPPPSESVVLRPHAGPDPRRKPRIKGPDLPALLELRGRAEDAGAGEALITTEDGIVVECALSAVVWWRDGTLCVPDPELPVLDSVTKQLVVSLARASQTPVEADRARLCDLNGREVWTLSALQGIRPVTGWLDCGLRAGPAVRSASWRARLNSVATPIMRS